MLIWLSMKHARLCPGTLKDFIKYKRRLCQYLQLFKESFDLYLKSDTHHGINKWWQSTQRQLKQRLHEKIQHYEFWVSLMKSWQIKLLLPLISNVNGSTCSDAHSTPADARVEPEQIREGFLEAFNLSGEMETVTESWIIRSASLFATISL